MPLSGGTAGAHDDGMHQDSAKRDTAGGLVGVNAAGYMLGVAHRILLHLGGSNQVSIWDRTNVERIVRWIRNGANDFEGRITVSNVEQKIQVASDKDVVNGIAGLDANVLLSPALLPPCLEEYSNHLGAVDNYMQTVVNGNGVAAADAANHEMDLSSGITVVGNAAFQAKDMWTLGSEPIVFTGIIRNQVDGDGGTRRTVVGLKADLQLYDDDDGVYFQLVTPAYSVVKTVNGGTTTQTVVTSVADGDVLTIVATSAKVMYFINGVLEATHTTDIPVVALEVGVVVHARIDGTTVARSVSVDMLSMKRYV